MGIGLREAEKLTGFGRSTLQKAIKSGKLSATRGSNGAWEVDVAELQRVYELRCDDVGSYSSDAISDKDEVEGVLLRQQIYMMERTIDDLRERLTRSDEERTRLTLMLTQSQTDMRQPRNHDEVEVNSRWVVWLGLVLVALVVGLGLKAASLFG